MKTKPPCEFIVNKVLPAIRSTLVLELSERYGLTQTKISELLGLTQPAVSQYLSKTRGKHEEIVENFPQIKEFAEEQAKALIEGDIEPSQINVCEPCRELRALDQFCEHHQVFSKVPEDCQLCLEDKK